MHRIAAAPVKPTLSLIRQSAVEQKYRAVAHYNLEHLDLAFENARQAVRLDAAHTVPLAEQFRNYIQHEQRGTKGGN